MKVNNTEVIDFTKIAKLAKHSCLSQVLPLQDKTVWDKIADH